MNFLFLSGRRLHTGFCFYSTTNTIVPQCSAGAEQQGQQTGRRWMAVDGSRRRFAVVSLCYCVFNEFTVSVFLTTQEVM